MKCWQRRKINVQWLITVEKKSKAQRELEKLAVPVNYYRPARDSQNGVKLLKL